MIKFYLTAAVLSLAAVSPAVAKDEVKFTRDGVAYAYTVTEVGNSRVIEGKATPGSDFRLVVARNRVTGTANGMPVSFTVKDATAKAQEPITVASR